MPIPAPFTGGNDLPVSRHVDDVDDVGERPVNLLAQIEGPVAEVGIRTAGHDLRSSLTCDETHGPDRIATGGMLLLVEQLEFVRLIGERHDDRHDDRVGTGGQRSDAIVRNTIRGQVNFETEVALPVSLGDVNTFPEYFLLPAGIAALDEGRIASDFRDADRDRMRNGGQQGHQAGYSGDENQYF